MPSTLGGPLLSDMILVIQKIECGECFESKDLPKRVSAGEIHQRCCTVLKNIGTMQNWR